MLFQISVSKVRVLSPVCCAVTLCPEASNFDYILSLLLLFLLLSVLVLLLLLLLYVVQQIFKQAVDGKRSEQQLSSSVV